MGRDQAKEQQQALEEWQLKSHWGIFFLSGSLALAGLEFLVTTALDGDSNESI